MNVAKTCLLALAAVAGPIAVMPDECDDTAAAIQTASEHEAQADYWIRLANCLNDPDCDLVAEKAEADAELAEALDEIEDQYDARLYLCGVFGLGPYDPQLDPADFSANVTANRFLPCIPRRTLVYEKKGEDGVERVEVTALKDTRVIDGFECRAIGDRVFLDNVLIEDTIDWFAQHSDGTVWYFGEIAKNYENGFLDNIDGSWRAGKDGAKPGIVMLANPAVGDFYRQEFLVNEAEDVAQVVALNQTVVVPAGTFTGCLQTEDRSPLSPDSAEWKFYAPDVGLVLEVDIDSGERLELIRIKK